ncbi:hypothetical protein N865_05390 [Intrasporangium oryzae NRRL B-24470]|uniref:Uncharacterized protein n=1 Tax=Intrasporangium oryzae NRRL B-24470 TaxID=1386089 RepID=W9G536_9MICO|nr:DUF732 domain-containing protein [Intrasporangium oryzae]EWT01271.1 hypothetical protein N865_05390 [Intrasporangium oryzae NRRL B-24470]
MIRTTGRPRRAPRALACLGAALAATALLSACGSDPTLGDLPKGVAQARPTITAEEADFVLDAQKLGATVTGASVADDIETGTTTCWALQNGGVTLKQIAVGDDDQPLGNTGDALRTKQLMAAAVQAFCPDYTDQIPQLGLP